MTPTRTAVAAPQAYRVLRHPAPVDLRLDSNEGPMPDGALTAALRAIDPERLRGYPDAGPLEALIADTLALPRERVLVTAGADDAIDRMVRATIAPGTACVVHEPTFEMIPRAARLCRAEVRGVPWTGGPFPVDAALDALRGAGLLALVTPNNPTGVPIGCDELERLCTAAGRAGVPVLVDLAYGEYADADPTPGLLALPNVVVVRTFSKAWGLAGLRLGYAVGPPDLVHRLRAAGGPYAVGSVAAALGAQRLRHGADGVAAHVAWVRGARDALREALGQLGVPSEPSRANFVLARTPRAQWLRDGLAGLGIGVRTFEAPQLEDAVRITCPRTPAEFARLALALRTVLAPARILVAPDVAETLALDALGATGLPLVRAPGVAQSCDRNAVGASLRAALDEDALAGAWAVCATLEGIAGARQSGCVPLALRSPDAPVPDATAMLRAGAARVITTLDDLRGCIP